MKLHQSGNVLFLILIAVALFAALSYAVTSSNRGQGKDSSDEKNKLMASAILNYASALQSGILRMKLSNGCTDMQFDFSNPVYQYQDDSPVNTGNSNSPADDRCDLYSSKGGGVVPYVFPPESVTGVTVATWERKPGHGNLTVGQILNIGTDGPGGTESANDLFYSVSYITKGLCLKINDINGVTNPSGDAPLDTRTGAATAYINGDFATSTAIYNTPEIAGQKMYCARSGGSPEKYYIKIVLLAR